MAVCSQESSKGGYDYDFVDTPPKSLECPICLLTLREPHVISCCGHHFCRPCIERVQRDRKPCPLCGEENFTIFLHKGVLREVNALVVRCLQTELGCQWEGELGQLQQHSGQCGYVEVECVYQCGVSFLRRFAPEHEDSCSKRPLEVQLSSALKKLDLVLADNQALKENIAELKADNHTLKECVATLKADNQTLKENIAEQKERDKKFDREIEARKAESVLLKNQISRLEAAMEKQRASFHQRCVSFESRLTPVPPHVMFLQNVDHLRKHSMKWVSPPFFSHVGGYKFQIFVCPNGCTPREGTHVSLFVCLVQGEYDDQLQWPFQGSVTVQVFNRTTEKWDRKDAVELPMEWNCTSKPDVFGNSPYGKPGYIPHSQLAQYTGAADCLRIQIECVSFRLN